MSNKPMLSRLSRLRLASWLTGVVLCSLAASAHAQLQPTEPYAPNAGFPVGASGVHMHRHFHHRCGGPQTGGQISPQTGAIEPSGAEGWHPCGPHGAHAWHGEGALPGTAG